MKTGSPAQRRYSSLFSPFVLGTLALCGVCLVIGVGLYTFIYAKGYAYLTNNPGACANCHVMQDQYSSWIKSSHHAVAVCNDCHTPANIFGKYLTKASNGFWHSFYFTTGTFHDPIQIRPHNSGITEAACRKCHRPLLESTDWGLVHNDETLSCVRCHGSVGHMR